MSIVDLAKARCNPLSPVCVLRSPGLARVHGGVLAGGFITLVNTQTQTDWEWVEQSLSFSCQGKPCHQFRCEGGQPFLPYLAFHDSDICQILQLFLACTVQKEIEDLWSPQAEVVPWTRTSSLGSKNTQLMCYDDYH